MAERQMAEVFPPGDILKEELAARDWTQTDLAEIIGKSARLVNEVIAGKRAITPDTARALADAFGTSAQFWMNLESAYQLSRLKTDASPVTRSARLYSLFPVKEMMRRGWVSASESLDVLEAQFCNFFGIDNLEKAPCFRSFAARRSVYTETEQSPALTAWLFRAQQIAKGVGVGRYTDQSADAVIEQLKPLMSNPEDIRQVPRILADAGIRLVLVEPFPGMKLDGVCFWLDAGSPVIAMTLRYDRIDNFWFVLMHELRHVANKDGQDGNAIIDENLGAEYGNGGEKPEFERLADAQAAEAIIPATVFNDFALGVQARYSEVRISDFAARIGVHPGVVVGQLHNRKEVPFAHYRKLLVKVREHIVGNALTDGWGHHAPMA